MPKSGTHIFFREEFKKINSKMNDIVQKGGEVSEKNQILKV